MKLKVDLDCDNGRDSTRLSPPPRNRSTRFIQEALNNVVKHSGAKHAEVEVVESAGDIVLRVSDSGCGFDPDGEHAGRGLEGMSKRIELAGGVVSLESKLGAGTMIVARLPASHRESAPLPVAVAPV